jgi:cysteine desulfuration protein SufE
LSLKTGEISSDYGQSGDNPLCCLTMSDLNQRQDAIVEEFSGLNGWEGKYKRIIDLGKQLEALDDSLKSENLKVKGCQSQVWLHASLSDDKKVVFQADSDALIVKGLVSLLLQLYSNASADEILQTEPDFVARIGLDSHLSPSRTNGLLAMIKQIKYYAAALKALGA